MSYPVLFLDSAQAPPLTHINAIMAAGARAERDLIGSEMARDFGDSNGGVFFGKVIGYMGGRRPLYRAEYSDGDIEDLDHEQLQRAMEFAIKHVFKDCGSSSEASIDSDSSSDGKSEAAPPKKRKPKNGGGRPKKQKPKPAPPEPPPLLRSLRGSPLAALATFASSSPSSIVRPAKTRRRLLHSICRVRRRATSRRPRSPDYSCTTTSLRTSPSTAKPTGSAARCVF